MIETPVIDVVIAWVDGDDPAHAKKRSLYNTDKSESKHEDVGGSSRFRSLGEIRYCIESINIFAPFVRKIFIITDGQDPDLEDTMKGRFPEGHIPMQIVDHKVIFKGYESYLPTFNSRSIETMLWRTPGLSEHFILMNDDFVLTGPVTPEHFFKGDTTICYAKWYRTFWARFLRAMRPMKKGHKRISFKDSMLNAADILNIKGRFMYLGHTPRALRRSFYEDFFRNREDIMTRNICHRFRHKEQYNSQELFYLSEHQAGRCQVICTDDVLSYLIPKRNSRYIERKLRQFDRKPDNVFCCINSLSLASEADQQKVLEWVKNRMDQKRRKSL